MKLTKAKLISLLKPDLEKLGFIQIKDTITGSQGLFVKKLHKDFYLTLGLIIHRYYDSAFTGAFYLSKTTRWSSIWGDIPKESYKRPGYLLTDSERTVYSETEINAKEIYDIWWDGKDKDSLSQFLNVIQITESRFLNQTDLFTKVELSTEVNLLSKYSHKVKELINEKSIINRAYKFLPTKEIDNIPIIWFMAAEVVLTDENGILNSNTVKLLAADAYRQYLVDSI